MTYTKEFQEWAANNSNSINSLQFEKFSPDMQRQALGHIFVTLSAFVRLVREEANVQPHEPFQLKHTAEAFNSICFRFGLEEK